MGLLNPFSKDPKLMYLDPHYVQESITSVRVRKWMESLELTESSLGEQWIPSHTLNKEYHCEDIRT